MGRISVSLIFSLALISQAFSLNLHPVVTQYLQQAGFAPQPQPVIKSVPVIASKPPCQAPSFQTLAGLISLLSSCYPNTAPRPITPNVIPSLPSLPSDFTKSLNPTTISTLSEYLSSFSKLPTSNVVPQTTALESLYSSSSAIDPTLVNSLVLALQILVLSSLLNAPSESPIETGSTSYSYEKPESLAPPPVSYSHSSKPPPASSSPLPSQPQPSAQSNYYSYYDTPSYSMPNANFVGTSSFMDSNPIMSSVPYPSSSRNGLALMSPYEALNPGSPYSDPILSSPYGSVMNSKRDFQSPYALLTSETKDVLNFSDFF